MMRLLQRDAKRGLSEKIAFLIVLLVGISLATTTAVNIWTGQRLLEERSIQRALTLATLLSDASSNYLFDLRVDEIEILTAEISRQSDILYAYIVDSDDMLLVEADGLGERYDSIDDPLSRQARREQRELIVADDTGFHVAAPIYMGGEELGIVRLALSREPLNRQLSSLRDQSLWLGLVLLIAGLLVSRSFIGRAVRPLKELTVATRAISHGELTREISITTNDEIQDLAEAFNQMTSSLRDKDAALSQRISELARVQQQLHNANQGLEARVVERTQELEKALAAAQEATRLKSEFLANMSHEIRTPINGVLGMTELLTKSHLDGKQKRFAGTILSSAQSLLGTINDILDFSKIEAGKLDLDSAPFDLRVLVEDVVQQLGTIAHRKQLELISDVALDVHTAVRGDAQRLRQILTNLIGNAIKFTKQGQVAVRVCLSQDSNHSQILFKVSDTGIGISADAQARIFESFTQADGSTSRQFGGTGLGLAISKKLVVLMEGTIGVESELGKGAIFWFTAQFEQEPLPSNAAMSESGFDDLKLLVVDDNDTNREILERQLGAWNVEHDCVADGESALELLRSACAEGQPYDAVLVDRFMPSMDGFSFARLVREDVNLAVTKLVLLSSMTPDRATDEWRASAFASSLTKPLRQSDLYQCLRNLDQGHCPSTASRSMVEVNHMPTVKFVARVLVAEDNAVNQDLIEEALGQLGCRVTLVEDGSGAVQAFQRENFDLVFMDCQMPGMDGFEATEAVRRLEKADSDGSRTPIIALTANAMEGDRNKCLAAGMDDYLAKPFMQADLIAMLSRWLLEDGTALAEQSIGPAPIDPDSADPIDAEAPGEIDPAALNRIRQMAGSKGTELLIKIIGRYLEKTPALMSDLAAATKRADYDQVRHIAHGLKSSSANLGASRFSAQCKEVETACRVGEVDGIKAMVEKIVADYENIALALRSERERIKARPGELSAPNLTPH